MFITSFVSYLGLNKHMSPIIHELYTISLRTVLQERSNSVTRTFYYSLENINYVLAKYLKILLFLI